MENGPSPAGSSTDDRDAVITQLNAIIREKQDEIKRMREAKASARRSRFIPSGTFMYAVFRFGKRAWQALGSPFPGAMRFVRYELLGHIWPVRHTTADGRAISHARHATNDVAVIIPCHNYGHMLARAIESVLDQSIVPREILVVDDSSTDDTAAVARRYAEQGVGYIRGEWRHLSHSRNAGAFHTTAAFLLYLDADDYLPPDYIEQCTHVMNRGSDIAIVYTDMQEFGDSHALNAMPTTFDADHFERISFISSHALIRRQAFDLVGGYRIIDGFEDWDFYKRVLSMGFTAAWAPTFVYYNVHGDSMYRQKLANVQKTYADNANLFEHPVTIFTPFAGRMSIFDQYLDALRALDWDPKHIHLHWYNTSRDPAFDERLRSEITRLPFADIRYAHAPLPELWDLSPKSLIRNRMSSFTAGYYYELAVVRAYNEMLQTCDTEFVLTLEDDIAAEPALLNKMFSTLDTDIVAVVAPYMSQLKDETLVWHRNAFGQIVHYPKRKTGIEEVGGSGFGCSLFRTSALKKMPIYTEMQTTPQRWYDHIAFERLAKEGKVVCNWDIDVEHLKTKRYADETAAADIHSDIGITL